MFLIMEKARQAADIFTADRVKRRLLPVLAGSVPAGFPSPAEDYVEGSLDLNEHLIRHPAATFIIRVKGDSMAGAGIRPGDLLVVDRSLEPRHGSVVVAVVGGELTLKRLCRSGRQWQLQGDNPENPDFPAIAMDSECVIWGVVTSSIHRFI
ncbi:MAG: translesion error-prone DNA polymerase V autoproteolytic subunit [Rhodospirillales bacterium]